MLKLFKTIVSVHVVHISHHLFYRLAIGVIQERSGVRKQGYFTGVIFSWKCMLCPLPDEDPTEFLFHCNEFVRLAFGISGHCNYVILNDSSILLRLREVTEPPQCPTNPFVGLLLVIAIKFHTFPELYQLLEL